jgi:hypothetical protein
MTMTKDGESEVVTLSWRQVRVADVTQHPSPWQSLSNICIEIIYLFFILNIMRDLSFLAFWHDWLLNPSGWGVPSAFDSNQDLFAD